MSNYLAIATVTATLQRLLQSSIQADVDGSRVTTLRPDKLGSSGTPEAGVNLYLYDILLNIARRNSDIAGRYHEQGSAKRPHSAVDLYYLVSCYGNDNELEPQRLLGSVIRTFTTYPTITPEMVREAIVDPVYNYLSESNVADQPEPLSVSCIDLGIEDLSRIWSVFFQTPYILTTAYKISVVTIESDIMPKKSLPVRNIQQRLIPNQPLIEKLMAVQEGDASQWRTEPGQLFVPTSTVIIRGKQLRDEVTQVRVGEAKVVVQEVSPNQINLSLASVPVEALQAGAQSLQVIHPNRGSESNVMAFVLLPVLMDVAVSHVEAESSEGRSAEVTVQVSPRVGKSQRVVLILNEASLDNPEAYTFTVLPPEDSSATLSTIITGVKPGSYLVRLQVDGAESLLAVDMDSDSPTFDQYTGPILHIS